MHLEAEQQAPSGIESRGDEQNDDGSNSYGLTATYSPDDNKLRLYALRRLPRELYDRINAAGFRWAPKQELFVAPMWTPAREDILLELCGEIGDEDTSLVDRAEQRADRFEGYSDRRRDDARNARDAAGQIAQRFEFGQPILVGHHSEKKARKDAERIQNSMRKAVQLWNTADYWTRRAEGALADAKYKERPDVRARRIKGIEADQRKAQRQLEECNLCLAFWGQEGLTLEAALQFTGSTSFGGGFTMPKKEGDRPDFDQRPSAYTALGNGYPNLYAPRTLQEVQDVALRLYPRRIAFANRWIAHYENRLSYERAMLGESGYIEPPKRASRAVLPLLNYAGRVEVRKRWGEGTEVFEAEPMTKAEFAKIHDDYKGTRISADGTHRVRICLRRNVYSVVYLTDSKQHPRPGEVATGRDSKEQAVVAARIQKGQQSLASNQRERSEAQAHNKALLQSSAAPALKPTDPEAADFDQLAKQAKQGVQVVSAPQLFITPQELARRMADLADLRPGDRVLEPSAGTGRLLDAIASTGIEHHGIAVEVHPKLAEGLKCRYPNMEVRCGDFLDLAEHLGGFDVVMMNPPFANAVDIAHIRRAFELLAPGGRLVALCAAGPRQADQLRPLAERYGGFYEVLAPGSFAGSGTMVNVAILVMERLA